MVVEEHAEPGSLEVVELTAAHGPDEAGDGSDREQQAQG
jgi:hypothetical protein